MCIRDRSWSVRTGGVALSVATHKAQGDLKKISTIIAKYSNIESVLSLQPSNGTITLMFTLPLVFDSITLQKLVKHLEKRHFEVISIENLQRFN